MARRRAEATTVDEAAAFEGIGGDDPAPGAPARRRPGRPRKTAEPAAGNRGRIAARTPSGAIRSKASMIAEVEAQLGTMLYLGQALWATRDPACASSATPERIDTITSSTVALIARNPKMLQYAATSGIIGDLIKLGGAVAPIVVAVVRAHGPGARGHADDEGMSPDVVESRYPAYAAAG